MFILGIDPGFTGALSAYDRASHSLCIHDMPVLKDVGGRTILNLHRILELLDVDNTNTLNVTAVLEYVAARPNQSAPATFRFGQGYGALQMALAAKNIPVHYVTPAKWKRHFGLSREKGISRAIASQRFPAYASMFSRVKDDGRAEATLIALYGAEKLISPLNTSQGNHP